MAPDDAVGDGGLRADTGPSSDDGLGANDTIPREYDARFLVNVALL